MVDISNLTKEELAELQKEISHQIKIWDSVEFEAICAEFQELADKYGVEVTVRRKRKAAPIKYQDPENPDNTWSGRGVMPNWMKAKIEDGASREDFEIGAEQEAA